MRFGQWQAVEWPRVDPRWVAVEPHRVAAIDGLTDPASVHAWARANLEWRPDLIDDWSPPAETLARRGGDCEDWCIAERALLLAAGWPDEDIWMVVARDLLAKMEHALLVADGLALDCRGSRLIPVDEIADYRPIVAFRGAEAFTFGRVR
jgi:hypothetical protein